MAIDSQGADGGVVADNCRLSCTATIEVMALPLTSGASCTASPCMLWSKWQACIISECCYSLSPVDLRRKSCNAWGRPFFLGHSYPNDSTWYCTSRMFRTYPKFRFNMVQQPFTPLLPWLSQSIGAGPRPGGVKLSSANVKQQTWDDDAESATSYFLGNHWNH